jgi:hypothetical protein
MPTALNRFLCIFTLFSFQLDTLTLLYNYNLGSFFYLYMFRTDRSIIRRSNAFIAQAASGTVSSVVVCLGRNFVSDQHLHRVVRSQDRD